MKKLFIVGKDYHLRNTLGYYNAGDRMAGAVTATNTGNGNIM